MNGAGALRQSVDICVTYWPAAVGPYMWHEFDAASVAADLHAMTTLGVRTLRILLPWDAFMPSPERVAPRRLRDLEAVLGAAERESLRVIPVLFAQALGDCVMLPAYAIDVAAPRQGRRVVTDAVVQPGGPRDQYTDPMLLETEITWLETLLDAFAGHAALHSWDLGLDPATAMRPRRIDDMPRWLRTMSERVHARRERVELTLGVGDVVSARAVRPNLLAPSLDACTLDLEPLHAPPWGALDTHACAFLAQLTHRLMMEPNPLSAQVHAPETGCIAPLVEVGCAGISAGAWSDVSERALLAPPFDQLPELGHRGLVDAAGMTTAFGAAWRATVAAEMEQMPQRPWPADLDIEEYYANLPESALELFTTWKRDQTPIPDMLH